MNKKLALVLGGSSLVGVVIAGIFFSRPMATGSQSAPLPQPVDGLSQRVEPTNTGNTLAVDPKSSSSPDALAAAKKSRELTQEYISKLAGSGPAGRDQLDHIRSLMQPLSREHMDAIENLIKKDKVGGQEMASLIIGYGDQLLYDPSRLEIAENIKAVLLRTKDRDVGNAAISTFSRLGPIEELATLLKHAKANNFVSDNDYYGEIGHGFLRANTATQNAWLEELNAANNVYSREILAYHIGSRGVPLDGMNPKTAGKLLEFFKNNETQFSSDPGVLGVSKSVDYVSWLTTCAKLAAVATNADPEKYIQGVLLNKDIDTRKTLSYFIDLSDADTEAFKKNVSLADRKDIADRLIAATYKHPTDSTMEYAQKIYTRLTGIKASN